MLLYTIASMEDVFGGGPAAETEIRPIKGGYVEVCRAQGVCTVSRLISTDPALYLRQEYAPGARFDG